jgi:hypothetical protein
MKDAQSLLSQLKEVYIQLPEWLQTGVESWTKTSIKFANGNRLLVSNMSPCGLRGYGIQVLMCENVHLVDELVIDDFVKSLFPVVSASRFSKCWVSGVTGFNDEFDKISEHSTFTRV